MVLCGCRIILEQLIAIYMIKTFFVFKETEVL